MRILCTLCAILVSGAAWAQEVANPVNTTFTDALGDSLIAAVQTHPGTVAGIVGLWVVQTIIKAILATTKTKDVWWYKALELLAGIVGKVKSPVVK